MSEGIEPTNTAEKVKRLPKRLRPKPPKKPRQKAPKVVRACVLTPNFDADKAKVVSDLLTNANDRSRAGRADVDIVPLLESINSLRDFFTTSSCSGRLILVQQPCVQLPSTATATATVTAESTAANNANDDDSEDDADDDVEHDDAAANDGASSSSASTLTTASGVEEISNIDVEWICVKHDVDGDLRSLIDGLWQALTSAKLRANCEVWFKEVRRIRVSSATIIVLLQEAPIVAVCARTIDDAQAIANVCKISGVKRSAITSLSEKIILSIADTHKVETVVANETGVLIDKKYFDVMVRIAHAKLIFGR